MNSGFNRTVMDIMRRGIVPALGCTEPVAVALASATACRDLGLAPESIAVRVSDNLFKNGMGVMVPGTGRPGLDIAAAAGALGGDPELGLEVLRPVTPDIAEKAGRMVDGGRVTVELANSGKILYAEATVSAGAHSARAVIEDAHDRVTLREKDGGVLFRAESDADGPEDADVAHWPLSLSKIWEYASNPPDDARAFMEQVMRLNEAAGDEGLKGDYGMQVGKSLIPQPGDILGDDAASYAVRLTAAGSDLRMAGAMMPVMSNSGSGNQGLACTLPVVAIARRIGADKGEGREKLVQALLVSHLVSIHIKHFVGKLSALCGAITASTGASCGLVYLLGGDVQAAGRAIRNMSGDVAGMICDGAKYTCALKVATTTDAAVKAARLALKNQAPDHDEGIVDDDAESSILHLARLAQEGMAQTDKVILDIMINKKAKHQSDRLTAVKQQ